jgi:DNA-directed RNA polymerase, mitochondrial
MGPDINRGMLLFSDGKRLGKDGLFWLKVHLANKFGKDKLPLVERAKFSESIIETVHRVAEDPKNNLDWLQGENPWQTLACMFELSAAMKLAQPEEYVCHLHVHVDGSCNGMQHYAAFGRDENGGRQVNLADSERPGDVYTAILKLVLNDIENEKDPTLIEVAESLKGKVNRKTIKQTVMTSVYGVTFIGAKEQIQR